MADTIYGAIRILYRFIRNPFSESLDDVEDDKSLVVIASILSACTVYVTAVTTILGRQSTYYEAESYYIFYVLTGLLLTPLFGLLIVHFAGGVFHLYLKYIASPLFKATIDNMVRAKQITTFATIGLVVSSVPSLTHLGTVIAMIIEVLGLYRLFDIGLIKSFFIAVVHRILWGAAIAFIASDTRWI